MMVRIRKCSRKNISSDARRMPEGLARRVELEKRKALGGRYFKIVGD